MESRDAFLARCRRAAAVEQLLRRGFTVMAVVLGLSQLAFLAAMRAHMAPGKLRSVSVAAFLVYVVVLVFVFWRRGAESARLRPACPSCRRVLDEAQCDAVLATGLCPTCRTRILAG